MAIKANLIIDQGTDYSATFNVTDDDGDVIDLTGATATAQMRRHYSSVSYHAFTTSINGSVGTVTISMNAATTNAISAGRYVYDCELQDTGGIRSRLVEGVVTVTPQVTR